MSDLLGKLTTLFQLCNDSDPCVNGHCIRGSPGFTSSVGSVASDIRSYCQCEGNYVGQFCNETVPSDFDGECNGGFLNKTNTITLCDCKNVDGTVLDSYGWYCETPNSEQCKKSFGPGSKPKKYHKPSETIEVGKPNCTYECPPNCNGCYGFINGK